MTLYLVLVFTDVSIGKLNSIFPADAAQWNPIWDLCAQLAANASEVQKAHLYEDIKCALNPPVCTRVSHAEQRTHAGKSSRQSVDICPHRATAPGKGCARTDGIIILRVSAKMRRGKKTFRLITTVHICCDDARKIHVLLSFSASKVYTEIHTTLYESRLVRGRVRRRQRNRASGGLTIAADYRRIWALNA
jgi:hypothetical protein